jgi:hypothetical protein
MEQVLLRFPMVAQQLFEQLNAKSFVLCRNVGRTWQEFIDDQKFYYIRKVGVLSKSPEFNWEKMFWQINHEG